MTHAERIPRYLGHIQDAIGRAILYSAPFQDVGAFSSDSLTLDAVIRTIEIMGEAATKIHKADPEFTKRHPEIPWLEIRTMRNKLIHDYFTVDPVVVWMTVRNDLPKLADHIDRLLADYKE